MVLGCSGVVCFVFLFIQNPFGSPLEFFTSDLAGIAHDGDSQVNSGEDSRGFKSGVNGDGYSWLKATISVIRSSAQICIYLWWSRVVVIWTMVSGRHVNYCKYIECQFHMADFRDKQWDPLTTPLTCIPGARKLTDQRAAIMCSSWRAREQHNESSEMLKCELRSWLGFSLRVY